MSTILDVIKTAYGMSDGEEWSNHVENSSEKVLFQSKSNIRFNKAGAVEELMEDETPAPRNGAGAGWSDVAKKAQNKKDKVESVAAKKQSASIAERRACEDAAAAEKVQLFAAVKAAAKTAEKQCEDVVPEGTNGNTLIKCVNLVGSMCHKNFGNDCRSEDCQFGGLCAYAHDECEKPTGKSFAEQAFRLVAVCRLRKVEPYAYLEHNNKPKKDAVASVKAALEFAEEHLDKHIALLKNASKLTKEKTQSAVQKAASANLKLAASILSDEEKAAIEAEIAAEVAAEAAVILAKKQEADKEAKAAAAAAYRRLTKERALAAALAAARA